MLLVVELEVNTVSVNLVNTEPYFLIISNGEDSDIYLADTLEKHVESYRTYYFLVKAPEEVIYHVAWTCHDAQFPPTPPKCHL